MSLIWHIVRKDLRRVAAPFLGWLTFLLVQLWLLSYVWKGQHGLNPTAFDSNGYFITLLGTLVKVVGMILAAWLVMEDNVVSTRVFWRTRPVSGLRLLAAKTVSAVLMFSVLPVLLLFPFWLWYGFSVGEIAAAAVDFSANQALASLAGFALAVVTESSGQFLLRLMLLVIALPAYVAYSLGVFAKSAGPDETQGLLISVLLVLTPLAMVVHQYRTGRTRRTALILVAGLALLPLAGRLWPWNFMAWRHDISATMVTPPNARPLAAETLIYEGDTRARRIPVYLDGRAEQTSPESLLRVESVQGWWVGADGRQAGPRFRGVASNGRPTVEDFRRIAGLPAPAPSARLWVATGWLSETQYAAAPEGHRLVGLVEATRLRGTHFGELPLRAGATFTAGSSDTRIKSVRARDDKVEILIEERDAWAGVDLQLFPNGRGGTNGRSRPHDDGFLVLNRAQKLELPTEVMDLGTATAFSIVVGRRLLTVTPPEGAAPDWIEGAVIVKVRFTPADTVRHVLPEISLVPKS